MPKITQPKISENQDLLKYWNWGKNKNFNPADYTCGCMTSFNWKCPNCNYEWVKKPNHMNHINDSYCPECNKKSRRNSWLRNRIKENGSLKDKCPDLMIEWDHKKNKTINIYPEFVMPNSNKKVYWLCPKKHSYQATPSHRTHGTGCPYCSGLKAIPGETDLQTTHPDVFKRIHPTKNVKIDLFSLKAGAVKKIWWLEECGHEYEMKISDRVRIINSCPICRGERILPGFNDFSAIYPDIAKEMHPVKNNGIDIAKLTPKSNKYLWWICPKRHEYRAMVHNRTDKGSGCPYCANLKVLSGYNDLQTLSPEIAKEYDCEKNIIKSPSQVLNGSGKKAWWKCKYGHSYQTRISSRTRLKTGCPKCYSAQQTSFGEQAIFYYIKQIFPDAINCYKDIEHGITELDIFIPSLRVGIEHDGLYWHSGCDAKNKEENKREACEKCGISLYRIKESEDNYITAEQQNIWFYKYHDWDRLNIIIRNLIYILSGKTKEVDILKDEKNILQQYVQHLKQNSFLSKYPNLSKEWLIEENNGITPDMITPGNKKLFWWKCGCCGQKFQASPVNRTRVKKDNPFCRKCKQKIGWSKKGKKSQ